MSGALIQNKDEGIIEVWNNVLNNAPSLRQNMVEELMVRVPAGVVRGVDEGQ